MFKIEPFLPEIEKICRKFEARSDKKPLSEREHFFNNPKVL